MTRTMRTVALAALLGMAGPAMAQSDLEARRDKKMAEEWFTSNQWIPDYDVAREQAKESGKVIFAYFTRSYSY